MQKKNKDINLRLFLIKNEIKFLTIKGLIFNSELNDIEKKFLFNFLSVMYVKNRKMFNTKILNKSIFLKSSGSVNRELKLSRWEIKKLASFGQLKNLRKGSW